MKSSFSCLINLLSVGILLFLSGCTKNPFSDDKILCLEEIHGKVVLNDGASPDSVYVWLEGFNSGTWTNEQGDFEIKLPSVKSQGGTGLTGAYHIYFYVANYRLDSAVVAVRNGMLQYSHGDIDEKGHLKKAISLVKALDIQTVVKPPDFPQPSNLDWWEYEEAINVEVTLKATTNDRVIAKFYSSTKGPASILFVKKIYPEEDFLTIFETTPIGPESRMVTVEVSSDEQIWYGGFSLKIGDLPKGKYKIIPYFLIDQQSIPDALFESLGLDKLKPVPQFLIHPFRREGGDFEVKR